MKNNGLWIVYQKKDKICWLNLRDQTSKPVEKIYKRFRLIKEGFLTSLKPCLPFHAVPCPP